MLSIRHIENIYLYSQITILKFFIANSYYIHYALITHHSIKMVKYQVKNIDFVTI